MLSPHAMEDLLDTDGPVSDDYERLAGATDCEQGCVIEPDGTCPHGWDAAELTLIKTQP